MNMVRGQKLEEEFNQIALSLGGDVESRAQGDEYLRNTHALYHGGPAPWAFTPKIFDDKQALLLKNAAETMGRIMDKLTSHYLVDATFRKRFSFSPKMESLTLVPSGYERLIPLARVDIFFNEQTGDFSFCELNTDGSAGMTNTAEITDAIRLSATYHEFALRHPHIEVFDIRSGCIDAIIDAYRQWTGKKGSELSDLAVVDYADAVSTDEVTDFIERFQAMGINARFSDIRDLKLASVSGHTRLVDGEGPIECVWRRAVTCDVEARFGDGPSAFVEAMRRNIVCSVGGFRTWPCATKTVFTAIKDPEFRAQLSDEEVDFIDKHIPETYLLGPTSDLKHYQDKDRWIIKPSGGYNSVGVKAGLDCSSKDWKQRLNLGMLHRDVIQAYAPQYVTDILRGGISLGKQGPLGLESVNNMEGLYLFGGKFGGVFTRCAHAHTIGEFTGRLNMGCLVVHE